jgi:DNA-binding beta-propeller fold protein YncE
LAGLVSWIFVSAPAVGANLFVSDELTDQVLEYNGTTGAFITDFVPAGSGGLNGPIGLVFGPNGNLFVSSFFTSQVLEYNGTTGAFVTDFVSSGSGGLSAPWGLVFGPNGNLFVGTSSIPQVQEYNGTTGAFITQFVSVGGSGPTGLAFGPNGNLFVSSNRGGGAGNRPFSQVQEYNGTTGAFITDFVSNSPPGAQNLVFGPNGNLFVAVNGGVLEYNGTTGAFITDFVSGVNPLGLVFGPNGNLFVSTFGDQVLEYKGTTGAFITDFVSAGSGGLEAAAFLTFGPQISVPEPATLSLLGLGILSIGLARRRGLMRRGDRTGSLAGARPDRLRKDERRRSSGLAGGCPIPDRRVSGASAQRITAMELEARGLQRRCRGGLNLAPVNKVHHGTLCWISWDRSKHGKGDPQGRCTVSMRRGPRRGHLGSEDRLSRSGSAL